MLMVSIYTQVHIEPHHRHLSLSWSASVFRIQLTAYLELESRAFHTQKKSFEFSEFEIAAKIDPKRRTKLESERTAHMVKKTTQNVDAQTKD